MSIGQMIVLIAGILIAFGVMQRVLDRLKLTDRQALFFALILFVGGFLPDIPIGNVRINIGGAVAPIVLCAYLFITADHFYERLRAVSGTFVTAAAVMALSRFFPDEPEAMPFDINYLYGVIAGVIACLVARSRRNAFISGAMGVLLSDILEGVLLRLNGSGQKLYLGGAGAMDVVVIAGVTAVLVRELAGEFSERCARGAKKAGAHGGK